jgi:hypothetical protein
MGRERPWVWDFQDVDQPSISAVEVVVASWLGLRKLIDRVKIRTTDD